MKKMRYQKPVARDINSAELVRGSCLTGHPEYQMANCSTTGNFALNSCGGGSIVYDFVPCTNGSAAGGGCVNGYGAG